MPDAIGNEIPLRIKFVKGEFVPESPGECEPHTPHPAGYWVYSEWADVMMHTHVQRQCKGCGLWAIWEPKTGHDDGAADGGEPA